MNAADPTRALLDALAKGAGLPGSAPHPGPVEPRWPATTAAQGTEHAELMRALFELSPLGLELLDVQHHQVLAVNASLSRITGYSHDALMRGAAGLLCDGPAPAAALSAWMLDNSAEAGHPSGQFGPLECAYEHPSGRLLDLVFHGVRVRNAAGRAFLWLSVADATERHALDHALRVAATRDRLTGLLNRHALTDALQARFAAQCASHRAGHPCGLAVLFLDFDRFKVVNDALGHSAGDELLRGIARRLQTLTGALQPADGPAAARAEGTDWIVGRIGGDEFVAVVPTDADGRAARLAADDLLQVLQPPFDVRQQPIHTSASIGIALWTTATQSADDLLRDADIAMYEAKRAGRARWVLFDDTMRARLVRATRIESELRHAVSRQQLQAVYQPIVDLETGAMSSVEALLRWHHPEMGLVSPTEFIPVAEESGHIQALGEWILRASCLQWTAWQSADPALAPATISVNLSREQVTLGRRVITLVSEALAAAQMPPSALQLEITEREVMKNPEQARELLLELSRMGVKLAMDDFGTGTSSLGCLREFPFDTIKIDKSFVTNVCRDPHVLAVAHATVTVIENLGMVSVAEGIEDPAEVAALQAMGCRYGQGYLFARPVPGDELLAAVAGGSFV